MEDINFTIKNNRFNMRVAIALFCDNKVLLSKHVDESHYNLVGGRAKMNEDTLTAANRELEEELGIKVKNLKLVFVLENLFEYKGIKINELDFIYKAILPKKYFKELNNFEIKDNKNEIVTWFSKEELKTLNIKPEIIYDIFDLGDNLTHKISK